MNNERGGYENDFISASNIGGSNLQVGGSNYAPITLLAYQSSRPKLPVRVISLSEREGAREPLWAKTPTVEEAERPLSRYGLVVIEGQEGTGRLTSAIRSLEDMLSKTLPRDGYSESEFNLIQVGPDWDYENDLDQADLPDLGNNIGCLLDITRRSISVHAAKVIVAWGDQLRSKGSFLVVIADSGTWPEEDGLGVSKIKSTGPNPLEIVTKRLKFSGCQERSRWLGVSSSEEVSRFSVFGKNVPASENSSPSFGIFREVISSQLHPKRAVQIAEDIRELNYQEVEDVARDCARENSKEQVRAREQLRFLSGRLGRWTRFLEPKISEAGTRGRDRSLLVASAYMEGAQVESCIDFGMALGARSDMERTRRSREGRSPRKRMEDLGISITREDRVSFEGKPGFADEAIRLDWFHWPQEREETVSWILDVTKPRGKSPVGLRNFGDRILSLTRSEPATGPLFRIVKEWACSENDSHVREAARLLVESESISRLAGLTDEKMRQWAQADNTGLRRSVALACISGYGKWEPNKALTRLRWILHNKKEDAATSEALIAFRRRAASGNGEILRVTKALEKWFEDYPDSPAAPRAFLALVDADASEVNILPGLFAGSERDAAVYSLLVHFWGMSIDHPDVHEYAYKVLSGWMQGAYKGSLPSSLVYGIIEDVQKSRTPRDALARLLYGDPGIENPALVEARRNLARSRCSHDDCFHAECPINGSRPRYPSDSNLHESAGGDDLGQNGNEDD